MGSWGSWILQFKNCVGSCRSWILIFGRGTSLTGSQCHEWFMRNRTTKKEKKHCYLRHRSLKSVSPSIQPQSSNSRPIYCHRTSRHTCHAYQVAIVPCCGPFGRLILSAPSQFGVVTAVSGGQESSAAEGPARRVEPRPPSRRGRVQRAALMTSQKGQRGRGSSCP